MCVAIIAKYRASSALPLALSLHSLAPRRTAVLALLVAVCMALSGVPRPPRGAGAADWIAFCASAVAVDRLKDHFEGFATSLAAM